MIKIKQYEPSVILIPFVIYLLLFFSPLSSKAHNNYFYLFVLLPFVLFTRKKEYYNVIKSKIFISVIFLVSYLALPAVFNIQSVPLTKIASPLRHWFSFLVFFFLCVVFFHKYALEEKLKFVSIWAAAWGLVSIVLFFWDKPFVDRLVFLGRVEHPIIGACTYAVLFLFLLFSEKKPAKALRICALFVLALCVILSQSRGPILALFAAVLAGLIVQGRKIIPMLIGFSGMALWFLNYVRLFSYGEIFTARPIYRFAIWKQVISNAITNGTWLFGHGMTANETVAVTLDTHFQHAHSVYIATFFFGGIVGVVLLLILVFQIIKQSVRMRSGKQGDLIVSLIVFALLSVATDSHKLLSGPNPIWLFFWLPVAYLVTEEIKDITSEQ
jgi:hypothetical protein